MPGNVPNVSRDTFDPTKFYKTVILQQGVPVVDSDWNEQGDDALFDKLITSMYALGDLRLPILGAASGFQATFGASSDDFSVTAGTAIVDGLMVPTTVSDPPAALFYISNDNFISVGAITGVGGGSITDINQNWQSFHNLLTTAFSGKCRLLMTSGTENGNSFDIDAFTQTTLTLNGGTGAIASTDTYLVLPPLIPPAGTEKAYLQVWFEDINGTEDPVLPHPGLGNVETSHRRQLRWVLRVQQNGGAVPVTPSRHSFGVRYLELCDLGRSGGAILFFTNQIANVPYANFQTEVIEAITAAGILGVDNTNFSPVLVGNVNAETGGVGDAVTDLQAALDNVDARLVKSRAIHASVVSDAAFGGDFVGSLGLRDVTDAGDVLQPFAATDRPVVTLGSGTYLFGSVAAQQFLWDQLFGKLIGNEDPVIQVDAAQSADMLLSAEYIEGITFTTVSGRNWLSNVARQTLKYCVFAAGALRVNAQYASFENCSVAVTGPVNTNDFGLQLDNAQGTWTDCEFNSNSGAAASPAVDILNGIASNNAQLGLTFNSCQFKANEASSIALRMRDQRAPVTFRDCTFDLTNTADSWCVDIEDCAYIVFENCTFRSLSGKVLRSVNSNVTYRDCQFFSIPGSGAKRPMLICSGATFSDGSVTIANLPVSFLTCFMQYSDSNVDAVGAPTHSIISMGGDGGTSLADGPMFVDGLVVQPVAGSGVHNFTTLALWGTDGNNRWRSQYHHITFNALGEVPTVTGTLGGITPICIGALVSHVSSGGLGPQSSIKNLAITTVPSPATSHDRQILGLFGALFADGITVKGTSASPTATGYQGGTQAAVIHISGRCSNLDMTEFIPTSKGSNQLIRVDNGGCSDCHIELQGGHWDGSAGGTGIVLVGLVSNSDFVLQDDVDQAGFIRFFGNGSVLSGCKVIAKLVTTAVNPLLTMSSGYLNMNGCTIFRFHREITAIVDFGAVDGNAAVGNQFIQGNSGAIGDFATLGGTPFATANLFDNEVPTPA